MRKQSFPPRSRIRIIGIAAAAALAGCGYTSDREAGPVRVPVFEVDEEWMPSLPNDWVMASGLGLFVDAKDHVWISHRAELVRPEQVAPIATCCVPAPLVMEFDPRGNVVQAWGSHEESDLWPPVLHGLFVDHDDHVWSSARDQHQIMKFTRDGKRILTIGRYNETGGSNDPDLLGRPSDIHVDPETNEVFVVDGYTNRRVIVFDAETGAYRRHWGAYGEPPDDQAPVTSPDSSGTPPARQFFLIHGIAGSRDGLIYVADQTNSRIQVFRRDGGFVTEQVIRPGPGAATAVTLSTDPQQRFVFVADGAEHKIWILRRDRLEVIGEFGGPGSGPGQFGRPHNLAVDSQGNLYVAEADPGRRVQKFSFRGFLESP
jgi:DNA-binding beta-propeller fold protein YncE